MNCFLMDLVRTGSRQVQLMFDLVPNCLSEWMDRRVKASNTKLAAQTHNLNIGPNQRALKGLKNKK